MTRIVTFLLAVLLLPLVACGGRAPATRYYHLSPTVTAGHHGDVVVVLEPLNTDAAYDDERIVYRSSPYRLDYYDYHHWSAAPGVLVSNYLEEALEKGGHVGAVHRDLTTDADVVLSGRVAAIEEIDVSKQRWEGHIVLELQLSDARTGETLWTRQFDEREPLKVQNPEGLAEALSAAMARIVAVAGPAIAEHAAAAHVVPPRQAKGEAKKDR